MSKMPAYWFLIRKSEKLKTHASYVGRVIVGNQSWGYYTIWDPCTFILGHGELAISIDVYGMQLLAQALQLNRHWI